MSGPPRGYYGGGQPPGDPYYGQQSSYGGQQPSDPYFGSGQGDPWYGQQPPSDPYYGQQPADPYASPPQPPPPQGQGYYYGPPPQGYWQPPPTTPSGRSGTGAAIVGVFLVLLGIWFLFRDEIGVDIGRWWPVAAVALGVLMVLAAFIPRRTT